MKKFKFTPRTAKPAKPANNEEYQNVVAANSLLKTAKKSEQAIEDTTENKKLATFSRELATEDTNKINAFSRISSFSRGKGGDLKKHKTKFKPVTTELVRNFKISRQWILKNLTELKAKGWTRKKLFGAGRFKHPCGTWGPAWLSVWADPDMTPEIDQDGTLVFNFNKNGRQYRQTTRKEFYEKQHVR